MADKREMPRVDMQKEFAKLNETDQHFVRKIEQMNKVRATGVKKIRGRNKVVGALCGLAVVAIYTYTINAIKQEKFLDDFDEVPPESSQSSSTA